MLEGIAYGSELILETMRSTGFDIEDVVLCGGASRSDLWLQIHADVSGIPLSLTAVPDAPALGCAILAAVGAGCYSDVPTAADAMVKVVRTVEPDRQRYEMYRESYSIYKDSYLVLKDILHRQAAF